MTGDTSLKDGEAHPAALAALQYLNALGFQEKQDLLLTFSSLALEGNRLAEVCYGTLRRIIAVAGNQPSLAGQETVNQADGGTGHAPPHDR
jgi:hypothetical protein